MAHGQDTGNHPKRKVDSAAFGNPADVPSDFGTTPIPAGMVRFHHYTRSAGNLPSIMNHGLLARYAQESFAHGGTESPETFATAGKPDDDFKRSHAFVEGWADPGKGKQLNIGENYGGWGDYAARLESRRSTITFRGDVPASQMVAAHEPWHETYRYLQRDPDMEHGVMHGDYDKTGDKSTDKAIATTKTALAAKVMLGGALGGRP